MKRTVKILSIFILVFLFNIKTNITARPFYEASLPSQASRNSLIIKVNNKYNDNEFTKKYNLQSELINDSLYTIYITEPIEKTIEKIKFDQSIEYIESNYIFKTNTIHTLESRYSELWQFNNANYGMNPFEAWNSTYGKSEVIVGVLDTGIDLNHQDLNDNIWTNSLDPIDGIDNDGNGKVDDYYGYDFYANNNDVTDVRGHGTYVSGAIAAELDGTGVLGVAPNIKIMPLKVSDNSGNIYLSSVMQAIEYASEKGVRIFNMSFGGYSDLSSLGELIRDTDALFIVAAGNGGVDGIGDNNDVLPTYPASYEYDNIIAVAATDKFGALSSYSNFGPNSVDMGAPGTLVLTTDLSNSYVYVSGTSLSAPYVAGAVALIASTDLNFRVQDIKKSILNNTKYLPSLNNKVKTNGMLDIGKSFQDYRSLIKFDGGLGTKSNPYLISNADQLNEVRNYLSSSFRLIADIDLTTVTNSGGKYSNNNSGWKPIGDLNNPFTGNFNGDNKKITGLYINRPSEDYIGLFGNQLNSASEFKNLEVSGSVTGKDYTSLIIGKTNSILMLLKATGNIIGRDYVGGISGESTNLSEVFNESKIKGNNYVGGISGKSAVIVNASNMGSIEGISIIGGISGHNTVSIDKSYNIGLVIGTTNKGYIRGQTSGMITNCYFVESLFANSNGGVKLTAFTQNELSELDFTNKWNFDGRNPYLKNISYTKLNDYNLENLEFTLNEPTNLKITGIRNNYIYEINDATYANINQSGLITPLKIGTASIKIKSIELGTEKTTSIQIKEKMLGDLNGDKQITTTDLIILRKHLAGIENINNSYLFSSDINKDGNITTTDLVRIRRYLAGLEAIQWNTKYL